MIRFSILCLATASLGQFVPAGCPQTPAPAPTPVQRGAIATQAQADAEDSVAADSVVNLTATADGGDVTFSWAQVAGPGVRIEDAFSSAARFTAPSLQTTQTLRFRVSTTNTAGDVGGADVSVTVLADPNFGFDTGGGGSGGSTRPVARAGADQTVDVEALVTLNGAASTGRGLTFRWTQLSGPTVTLNTPTGSATNFTSPATFDANNAQLVFELVVRDSAGLTSRDSIAVRLRDPDDSNAGEKTRVRFETSLGNFTMELEDQLAPNTVSNFLQYVDDDFYDNTLVHRVVAGFVIQGGGFTAGLVRREPRPPINSEAGNGLSNVRATVSMALVGGDANSGTSQWFVNLSDQNTFLDDQSFTVFARVIEGMDVVDRIAAVEVTTRNGFDDVPVTDIVVRDVVRVNEESP